MPSLLDIRVQKLFLLTIILKVGSSFLGWYFQFQWSLGFWVPLSIMAAYIVLGLKRRDRDVTDEKFADSCYYLGFIFTITSIIFSLFDLPNIGTKMQDIAVRFGAAMVSTVAGLVVRVYLVSFKKDVADAIKDAEDAVLDASQKFREQLVLANERLRDFQSAVDTSAKETVERVRMQVEALSKNHADRLTDFFADLTNKNQQAFTDAVTEVRAATMRLSKSVDNYSEGMRGNIGSIEAKVTAFAEAVTLRLKNTTFPDEFFVERLEAPLQQVKDDAVALSGSVKQASTAVGEASGTLNSALRKLRDKAASVDGAMESVLRLTSQQHAVLDAAQGQLSALERIETSLGRFDALLERVTSKLELSASSSTDVATQVQGVISEASTARAALEAAIHAVLERIGGHAAATELVAQRIGASTSASEALAVDLQDNARAANTVLDQLKEVAAIDVEAARTLHGLRDSATAALERFDVATRQLTAMVAKLEGLDASVRQQTAEVRVALARPDVARPAPSLVTGLHTPAPALSQANHSPVLPAVSPQGLPPVRSAPFGSASSGPSPVQPLRPVDGAPGGWPPAPAPNQPSGPAPGTAQTDPGRVP